MLSIGILDDIMLSVILLSGIMLRAVSLSPNFRVKLGEKSEKLFDKHSSLLVQAVSDEEQKGFNGLTPGITISRNTSITRNGRPEQFRR